MALRPILPTDFITVLNALNDPDTVYVIPSFQRPYAWDKGHQVEDLLLDMNKASKTKGQHYLSALHLIPLNPESPDDRLAEFVDY